MTELHKILVTGGAGYLGSTLCELLLEKGHFVRVLDRILFGRDSIAHLSSNPQFQLIEGDIRHIEDIAVALQDVDTVVDLAAIVGAPACEKDGNHTVETNYLATELLVHASVKRNIKRFLFASTCSVYGANAGNELTEDSETNPFSLYARTKLDSERVLQGMSGTMESNIFRLATLCGPSKRMRFDLVLNLMTANAQIEQEVRVIGGLQWRPLLDVRDAARAFSWFIEAPIQNDECRTWNVGSNQQNTTIRDLGKLVAEEIGGARLLEYPGESDPRSYRVCFDRIEQLGFRTEFSLNRSIEDVAALLEDGVIRDYKSPVYYNAKLDY